jgi:CBS domain-containing protein
MNKHHIRHLPVLDNGALVGVFGIRDVVALYQPAAA